MVEVDSCILNNLEEILKLENIACKESALHGLGLWYAAHPERVECVIKSNAGAIPDTLADYAKKAVTGNIL